MAAVGPSGSGKSTWLHLLSGILKVQNGVILYGDIEISQLSETKRDLLRSENLGLIFQNNHFIKDLSVSDNLALPAYALKRPLDKELILDFSKKLSVDHLLGKRPSECSVGELQRLSILRTISVKPSFILADEPTSALDNKNAAAILDIFDLIAQELNTGILVVTHDERVKERLSNSIRFVS